jgi:UDP-N-acetylglucosamine--N-acetylmuramyl-(pentapeptide) pyrophosphoryl-undecaprenol N-acetylglucosamine transferase
MLSNVRLGSPDLLKMPRSLHIVFAGGVTPSHLNPGLAVAAHVLEQIPEAVVTFVGGGRLQERHVVRAAGFGFANLPSQPAPQKPIEAVRFLTHNLAGYWASRWFLKERRVSLVVGLGGPASAATVRAALSCGIPAIMLEQNVVPGRVTRWLARSASAVCAGFRQTASYFPSAVPVVVTGNPARPAFERLYRQPCNGSRDSGEARSTDDNSAREKRLIVLGGAGGARTLNESMPRALARLKHQLQQWQVVHQTGEGQLQDTARRYREAEVDALAVAYIDEMAAIMFEADLVVCRSAGTTLAELALAGVPAILVPYPPAIDYQQPNAEVFEDAGAATILDESDIAGPLDAELAEQLEPLLANDVKRRQMAAQMRTFACPEAATKVTDVIYRTLCGTSARLAA